ncbi:cysteine--tRNA ligase [Candidatus Bathyarchaeota archaeon]|nr:MAG: cysteine--tRNA ligase [Candidatus Bathyarchaeota archaeon]
MRWSGCRTKRLSIPCRILMRRRCSRKPGAISSPRRVIPRRQSRVRASFQPVRVSYRGRCGDRGDRGDSALIDPTSSELRVHNTLTRKLDKFEPIRPKRVNMFVCGPTVWDVSHIGHGKTYVAYDIIARYLRRKGFSVFFLLNITDIDDKIINKAHDLGEQPLVLADRLAKAFFKDMKELHVDSVNLYAKASDHIPEIIDQVTGLLKKGIAYRVDDDVYFDISKFPGYGKLSHQKLEDLTVHRVDPDPRKKHPGDFALWKSQKPGEIFWESPWGKGRPGWHIEDTAITLTYFGPRYDVHGGGSDLIFPHHEAEIAQTEGLTGKKPLARYWLHTGLMSIKGQEMHKSLGNFIPIRDMVRKVGAPGLRVFYAGTHYRSPLDFTEEALQQAVSLARRFRRAHDQLALARDRMTGKKGEANSVLNQLDEARDEFFKAMDDDFNTPGALAAYIRMVGLAEEEARNPKTESVNAIISALEDLGSVLGVLETETVAQDRVSELVNFVLELRNELRSKRDYDSADRIRDRMAKLGFVVEDSAEQTHWMT